MSNQYPTPKWRTEKRQIKREWSAMGHRFGHDMRCENGDCDRSYGAHQRKPSKCKHPSQYTRRNGEVA